MVLLSKILMLFILPTLLVFPNAISDKCNDFKTKVNDYYDNYILELYETENYTFMAVEGICNNELTYGVFLASIDANSYDIKIYINEYEYTLEEDSRGDTIAHVILNTSSDIKICVYDNAKGNSTKRYEYVLKYQNINDFLNDSNIIKGNNLGVDKVNKLKQVSLFRSNVISFIIILSSISLVCILWLLYLYIFKKGIFDKTKERISEVEFFIYENVNESNDNIEVEVIEEIKSQEEVYEKKQYFYEEDEADFNFTPFLQENGYSEDYSIMTEEEKNQVMVLLMTLKYKGTITESQYNKEVIKLWKK